MAQEINSSVNLSSTSPTSALTPSNDYANALDTAILKPENFRKNSNHPNLDINSRHSGEACRYSSSISSNLDTGAMAADKQPLGFSENRLKDTVDLSTV